MIWEASWKPNEWEVRTRGEREQGVGTRGERERGEEWILRVGQGQVGTRVTDERGGSGSGCSPREAGGMGLNRGRSGLDRGRSG